MSEASDEEARRRKKSKKRRRRSRSRDRGRERRDDEVEENGSGESSKRRRSRSPSPPKETREASAPKEEQPEEVPEDGEAVEGEEGAEKSERSKRSSSRSRRKKRSRSRKKKSRRRSRSRSRRRRRRSPPRSRRGGDRFKRRSRSRSKGRKSKPKFDVNALKTTLQAVDTLQKMGVPTGMGVDSKVLIQAAAMVKNTEGMDDAKMQQMLAKQAMQAADPSLTRPARRLYIGNLPIGIGLNEKILTDFFNETVPKLGITTPEPVMSCWLASDGAFCFAEFRSVQDATLCASLMSGITIGDRALRVGRPADYKAAPPGLENFIVGHPPGSFPPKLGAQAVSAAMIAGGSDPEAAAAAAAAVGTQTITQPGIGGASDIPDSKGLSEVPTTVLLLLNMVQASELNDDEEFLDIVVDVREECEKCGGKVEKVVVPRPDRPEYQGDGKTDPDPESKSLEGMQLDAGPRVGGGALGRIFVKFAQIESCTKAQEALDGRMFNNNRVAALYYQEVLFQQEAWDV